MFKKILLPLDGSELGESALPYIEELAQATGAEVILLQAIPPPHYDIALAKHITSHLGEIEKEYTLHATRAARDYLDTVKERLVKRGIKVQWEVREGSPAEAILDYVKEKDVNLIAMSTHGRTGVSRWVFGSVAEKVLHAAEVPVLMVRTKT